MQGATAKEEGTATEENGAAAEVEDHEEMILRRTVTVERQFKRR